MMFLYVPRGSFRETFGHLHLQKVVGDAVVPITRNRYRQQPHRRQQPITRGERRKIIGTFQFPAVGQGARRNHGEKPSLLHGPERQDCGDRQKNRPKQTTVAPPSRRIASETARRSSMAPEKSSLAVRRFGQTPWADACIERPSSKPAPHTGLAG